jgi:hypothetical protein
MAIYTLSFFSEFRTEEEAEASRKLVRSGCHWACLPA